MSAKQANKTKINKFLGIAHPWEGVVIPPRYDLRETGVYRQEPPAEEGGEPIDVFISAPIWVRSYSIDGGGHWYASVEFIDRMDVVRAITVPASRLYGQAKAVASELVGLGHYVSYDMAASLAKYLLAFRSTPVEVEPRKSEAEQIVDNVREFILRNEDRFQSGGEAFPVRSRAGYRYRDTDWWAFTSSAFLEASGSHSVVKVARILKKEGMLVTNDANNNMKCPLPNGRRVRMYVVAGHILECDAPTLSAIVTKPPPLPEIETRAAETRILEPTAIAALTTLVDEELGRKNPTNPIVTTIESSDIIADSYQESPAELDFLMTMRGKDDEPDNGGNDKEDDRAVALAAFYHEEGYPEDYPERHA